MGMDVGFTSLRQPKSQMRYADTTFFKGKACHVVKTQLDELLNKDDTQNFPEISQCPTEHAQKGATLKRIHTKKTKL